MHKFEQLIGKETYTLTPSQGEVVLKSDFKFTDRGTAVPLTATLTMEKDLTPRDFQIKGSISRFSSIENSVHGRSAGQVTIPPGENFFDIQGYAPVSVQMMLVRYWRSHGSPRTLKTLPRGEVQIQDQGTEIFAIGRRQVQLHKLSVRGLIWGMESLWLDSQDHLIALVSMDAEMDHFEAVAEGYEDGLAAFVTGAARDGMANLAKVASSFIATARGDRDCGRKTDRRHGQAGGRKFRVILRGGKIVAAGPAASIQCRKGAEYCGCGGQERAAGPVGDARAF